jgi:hypothetical protein
MILPTIHSGGTSRAALIRDYDAAAKAFKDFIDAWEAIEFNGRDYYVQGSPAWHVAVQERYKHTQALDELCDYLTEIRTHLHKHPQS